MWNCCSLKWAVSVGAIIHMVFAATVLIVSSLFMVNTVIDPGGCRSQVVFLAVAPFWLYAVILLSEGYRIYMRTRKELVNQLSHTAMEFAIVQIMIFCLFLYLCHSFIKSKETEILSYVQIWIFVRIFADVIYLMLIYFFARQLKTQGQTPIGLVPENSTV